MSLLPSIMPLPASRARPNKPTPGRALGSVDYNVGLAVFGQPISKPPCPAPKPDVFSTASPRAQARTNENLFHQARAKRPLESKATAAANPPKRPKVEEVKRVEEARPRKVDEKWVAKWIKVFPTLTLHFESGVDDAAGRMLRQRVLRLGASVDAFFHHKVTHLIIRGGSSPQKRGAMGLADKARDMGMKVWDMKKLGELVSHISPVEVAAADSLRTLLEDERLHGTRERDSTAPRPDHYYFKPGSKYVLIEDAIGRHRPIMIKEYPGGQPEWPVLHDTFLRTIQSDTSPVDRRARAWSLYVECKPYAGERPPGELRRATSMRNISGTPDLPPPAPYQIASGNSVVLTSNIASTSNANPSPFTATLGSAKDRAIKQLSKRVQVLKGNARLAAVKHNQPNDLFAPQRRASTGSAPPPRLFSTQEQVVEMLRRTREPKEEVYSKEIRVANHEKVYCQGGKEQDTAAGYCENCRLRYPDLSIHLASKKHRRFAHDNQNFAELDQLLATLRRPGDIGVFDESDEETEQDAEDDDEGSDGASE